MANKHVCVEAIDIDRCLSVRVLASNRHHYLLSECPYNVRDIWAFEYQNSEPQRVPFTEKDIYVESAKKLKTIDNTTTISDCLNKISYPITEGFLENTFEGKLRGSRGAMCVLRDNVPNFSSCFWLCDRDLRREDAHGRVRYCYGRNAITYTGTATAPDIIGQGTLLHLSLARWWKPKDAPQECSYLQISGFDIVDLELSERKISIKAPTKHKSKQTGQMTHAQTIGYEGELAARKWLEGEGFEILATNWRSGRYEIDIVAHKDDTIHIVEVKCRRAMGLTMPEDAIDYRKSRTLLKAATAYIGRYGWEGETQIDLIAVDMLPDGEKLVRYVSNAVLPHW